MVLLNTNLAAIYGVTAVCLEEALRRHEPLPGDFWFRLEPSEQWLSPVGGSDPSRARPRLAFTEHGALLAAVFLGTPNALEIGVQVVRAFVRRRQERR